MSSFYSACLAAALACAPATVAWWEYHRLGRGGESAVFTERVALVRGRIAGSSGIASFVIVMWLRSTALWAIPLLLLALGCASHNPRKALFGETWSLGRYLEWRIRVTVGTLGFWIVLAGTPALVSATPEPARVGVAALLLVALLLWHHFYAKVLLVVLDATPLQRPDLEPFFTPIFQRTTAIIPTLWRAGAEGGVFANALALPATTQGRVLFFDTLLERLAPNEVAAILAHEVAHLEHFHVKLLRRMYLVTTAGIVVIVSGAAALSIVFPAISGAASMFCPVVVLIGLALRARRMQAEETRSDRRAVVLCGDPEALVSGLTRLHEIHHMPRRLSPDVEQHATHPSLARRIRAIREGAVQLPRVDALVSPVVLVSSEPGRLAILEPERFTLVWAAPGTAGLVDDPIGLAKRIEARAYDQLTELRVSTAADGRAVLTARSLDGARWSVPLQAGEAERAQSALNVVDQLLAPPRPAQQDLSRRAVAAITLILTGALNTLWPILVPGLLALARPTRRICVTLACALVVTAFITGADSRLDAIRVLTLALLAAGAVWQSYRARAKEIPETVLGADMVRVETAALAIPVVLAAVWIVATSRDLFGLHTNVRDAAWLTASLMSLSVYLGMSTRQAPRRAAALVGVVTAAALFVGSSVFLIRVVRDPLVAESPEFVERTVSLASIGETVVEGQFAHVRLAPDGQHFLLSEETDYEEESARRHHVIGAFDGWSRRLKAVEAALAGDDRVLLVERRDGDTQLRAERFRNATMPAWTLKVRDIEAISLAAASDGRWHLMDRDRNAFTRVDGRVGTTATSRRSWDVQAGVGEFVSLHGAGSGHLGVGTAVEYPPSMLPWWLSGWSWREKTTLLRVDGEETRRLATSNLNVSCAEPVINSTTYVCVAFDGRVSHLWRHDVATGDLTSVGHARGHLFPSSHKAGGKIAAMRGGFPALVDPAARSITAYRHSHVAGLEAFDFTDEFLAVSSITGDHTVVTLYRLPDMPPTSGSFASRD